MILKKKKRVLNRTFRKTEFGISTLDVISKTNSVARLSARITFTFNFPGFTALSHGQDAVRIYEL